MDAATQLDRINAIHDDQPDDAAAALRALDAAALPAGRLRLLAFLLNHVLGEKLGLWAEALERVQPLMLREGRPLDVLRQVAVAARLAAQPTQSREATATLAREAGVAADDAALLVQAAALEFATAIPPAELLSLAQRAAGVPSGPLDEALGVRFNNVTNRLYYQTRERPLDATLRQALLRGADTALLFWLRTPGWMEHERALYLCSKMALRAGELPGALAAAERALSIIAANGNDGTERAFMLQLQAAALERCRRAPQAQMLRAVCNELATALDADTRALLAQDAAEFPAPPPPPRVAFIGGGNLAGALIGGLQRDAAPGALHVVEIDAARRAQLERDFGATTAEAPGPALAGFDVIVLSVKPQQMAEVCRALQPLLGDALLLSVAAGIRAVDIARWCGTRRVVRAMPNTPALIGAGIAGLAALPDVDAAGRALAERILRAAGQVLWFEDEAALDPLTAISGSGPAYVFRFIEALEQAGREFNFSEAQSRTLAIATFTGAAQLAAQSGEPPAVLRERVTSKGGTTAAALAVLEASRVGDNIVAAARAACARAIEMGDEFGRG